MVTPVDNQQRLLFCLPLLALFLANCASTPSAKDAAASEAARLHAASVVREARAEVEGLRSSLASVRIAAAKQEAELRQLRAKVAELRRTAETREVEMTSLQHERDRLAEARTKGSTTPEGKPTPATVPDLASALGDLSDELARVKRELARVRVEAASRREPSDVATAEPAVAIEEDLVNPTEQLSASVLASSVEGELLVTVRPGDTLSKLAQHYGVSVEELKEANGLEGDLIRVGQELVIPPAPELGITGDSQ